MPGWLGPGRCVESNAIVNKSHPSDYYDPADHVRSPKLLAAHMGCAPKEKIARCAPEATRAYQDMVSDRSGAKNMQLWFELCEGVNIGSYENTPIPGTIQGLMIKYNLSDV